MLFSDGVFSASLEYAGVQLMFRDVLSRGFCNVSRVCRDVVSRFVLWCSVMVSRDAVSATSTLCTLASLWHLLCIVCSFKIAGVQRCWLLFHQQPTTQRMLLRNKWLGRTRKRLFIVGVAAAEMKFFLARPTTTRCVGAEQFLPKTGLRRRLHIFFEK